jgi:hypothetical protein
VPPDSILKARGYVQLVQQVSGSAVNCAFAAGHQTAPQGLGWNRNDANNGS